MDGLFDVSYISMSMIVSCLRYGLLVDLRDNVSITVFFYFTYSGLHRCIVFFLSFVSLLHNLAIQPSRLQGCSNKISCQLSGVGLCCMHNAPVRCLLGFLFRKAVQKH